MKEMLNNRKDIGHNTIFSLQRSSNELIPFLFRALSWHMVSHKRIKSILRKFLMLVLWKIF